MELEQSIQRFHISPEAIASQQPDEKAEPVIPILQRSLEATASSQTLADVSPICVIVVGMAGSGKTTLMAALQRSVVAPDTSKDDSNESSSSDDVGAQDKAGNEKEREPVGYCLNLDPATKLVPFAASIDIRDTVDYKEVMKQHCLGPNGAIMTSLNLYATKFDQVLSILEKRAYSPSSSQKEASKEAPSSPTPNPPTQKKNIDYILVDTPGQIEAFTWSASGTIITSSLSSSFPTVLAFVVDTPRCAASLNTFMSNMLYACSMYYRTRLPLIVVFNKSDVVGAEVCMEWMKDYDTFQDALDEFMSTDQAGYYASLTRSLSLVLDEFYQTLQRVGVSAATGDGISDFWAAVQKACVEFDEGYVADLKCRVEEQEARKKAIAKDNLKRLAKDMKDDE